MTASSWRSTTCSGVTRRRCEHSSFALRRVDAELVGLVVGLQSRKLGLRSRSRRPTAVSSTSRSARSTRPPFATVVRRGGAARLPQPVVRRVHVACDGNPLFGKEVAALLAEHGLPDDPAAPIPVPPSASDAIGRRVAKLGRGTRDVLLGAAALPRPTVDVRWRRTGSRGRGRARGGGCRRDLVVDRGRVCSPSTCRRGGLRGRHAGSSSRRARAARERSRARPEERAPHLALAASRPSEAVAAEVEAAAAAAKARGALDTAGRLLEQAAAVTPARERAARRRRGLEAARCHLAAGDTDHARRLLDRLVVLSSLGEELAEVLLELALAGFHFPPRGFAYATAALENAQQSPALAIRIHASWPSIHITQGEPELSAEHSRAALAAAERSGTRPLIAATTAGVVFDDFVRGGAIVLDELERAVELERTAGSRQSVFEEQRFSVGMLAHPAVAGW